MAEEHRSAGEVFERLASEGLVDRERLPTISASLAEASQDLPWLLLLFMGAGAWVSAFCFIAFLGIAEIINEEAARLIPCGLVLVVAATAMRRGARHPFYIQLCLALSITGHVLFLAGVGEGTDSLVAVAAVSLAVCVVLYRLYQDAGQRFLSVVGTAGLAFAAVMDMNVHHAIHAIVLAEVVLLAALFRLHLLPASLTPLLYGLAVSVLGMLWVFAYPEIETGEWPSRFIVGGGLVGATLWVAPAELRAVLAMAAAAFASVASPGMSGALTLMILGAHRRERLLEGVGTAFFPAFLFSYYYSLEATLLVKSLLLMGCGVVLLGTLALVEVRARARGATS